eukprot:TRINITY_DN7141_c0_g1_i1.p1 TRINITY_DN7141_c0_g1~~TRINITY_DN7141_c0_g1_i1.p1  ORF type:complete len:437 (+),score=56.87 TRINITY_DN7141_c0_g1_i1:132-1442(+)
MLMLPGIAPAQAQRPRAPSRATASAARAKRLMRGTVLSLAVAAAGAALLSTLTGWRIATPTPTMPPTPRVAYSQSPRIIRRTDIVLGLNRPAHSTPATPQPPVSEVDSDFADPYHTGDVQRFEDGPPAPPYLQPGAVILILYGGRFGGSYFIHYALPRLRAHFLKCYPYPIHVFYEADAAGDLPKLRQLLLPSNVTFERINFSKLPIASPQWSGLPVGTTEATVEKWRQEGTQKKFQGRGYRLMCRFWTGPVWRFPSLSRYTHYLRLDTDSILPTPVPTDPFRRLRSEKCEYGFNRLKGENPHVLHQLWETSQRWMRKALTQEQTARVEKFALKGGRYWGPMYYNNFEMGAFALKKHPTYQSYFRFVDSEPPHGIFRYRWGDAPLHTIPVTALLRPDQMCNFSRVEFPYAHAPDKSRLKPVQDNMRCPADAGVRWG